MKDNQNSTTDIISTIDLFSCFRAFFCQDGIWEKLTDKAKLQHAFMLNRFLAIKHPTYIQALNKFHSVHVMDALHNAFKHEGRSPGWMYTKTQKSVNEVDEFAKYPSFIIQEFIDAHKLEQKSFDFLTKVHKSEVITYLDEQLAAFSQAPKTKKK